MKQTNLLKLVQASIFAALCCAATMVVHIPIPATNGYINMGDCVVLLGALLLGPVYGMAAGALGSMLADILLGYAAYAPGTMIIKGLMALCTGLVFSALKSRAKLGLVIAALCGECVMVAGYFAYEALILGYGLAAAAGIPGNAIQGAAGIAAAAIMYPMLKRVPHIKGTE